MAHGGGGGWFPTSQRRQPVGEGIEGHVGEVGHWFEGLERRGAHRACRLMAAVSGGRGELATTWMDGRRRCLGARRGPVNTCSACRAGRRAGIWCEAAGDSDTLRSGSTAVLGSRWLRSTDTWGTWGSGLELEAAVLISARRWREGAAVGAKRHWEQGASSELCFASKLRQRVRVTHLGETVGGETGGWPTAVGMKGTIQMSAAVGQKAQGRWQVGPTYLIISKNEFQIPLKFEIHNRRLPLLKKILKLCMRLDWRMLNYFSIGLTSNSQQHSCYRFWNRFKFETSLNFKGVQPSRKNLINSLKIFLDIIVHNVNLVLLTCIQNLDVPFTSGKWLGLNNTKKRIWIWIWNFKPSYTVEYITEVL
jgi:hypothetical protein